MSTPRVLVIAGSDSSGGAGLEADQRALAVHGCYAMTATTALTAQNTQGVEDVHITPPEFVGKQIRKVMEDGFMEAQPGVVKIGMLASAETVRIVAETLRYWQRKTGKEIQMVLDPVMVATSGAQLLQGDAIRNLRSLLLPMTTILTPNIPEATLLLRDADIQYRSPSTLEDLKALAKNLHSLGPKHVLLKGGHMPLTKSYIKATTDSEKEITIDVLYPTIPNQTEGDDAFTIIEAPYLNIPNTHGTGCSLASALAANLASNLLSNTPSSLPSLVRNATTFVSHGISSSPTLQSTLHNTGPGPINHFHSLLTSPSQSEANFTNHPFTNALVSGTLPVAAFKSYLIQDCLYLTHFARTYALAGYKSTHINQIVSSAEIILQIQKEMEMHLEYCAEFGISKEEIENSHESMVCTAYSRYVLDVGMTGDVLGLYKWTRAVARVVLLAALALLKKMARAAATAQSSRKAGLGAEAKEHITGTYRVGNRYQKWIDNYNSPYYRDAIVKGRTMIEDEIRRQGGLGRGRVEELVEIFRRCTEMEIGFWDDALDT